MITIRLGSRPVGLDEYAVSPLVQAMTGLRVLAEPTVGAGAEEWAARARARVPRADLELLVSFLPRRTTFVPDVLTPLRADPDASIGRELAALLAVDPARFARDVDIAYRGRRLPPEVCAAIPGGAPELERRRRPMPDVVRRLLDDGDRALLERLIEALRSFWDAGLADLWPGIRAYLHRDAGWRSDLAGRAGDVAALVTLHHDITADAELLHLENPDAITLTHRPSPVVLLPSVFLTRSALFSVAGPRPAALVLPTRLPGSRGHRAPAEPRRALADLLGPTRAALLLDLDHTRTTAELASRHHVVAGTASYHLGVLHHAGIVDRRRDGRTVHYRRNDAGTALVHAATTTGPGHPLAGGG